MEKILVNCIDIGLKINYIKYINCYWSSAKMIILRPFNMSHLYFTRNRSTHLKGNVILIIFHVRHILAIVLNQNIHSWSYLWWHVLYRMYRCFITILLVSFLQGERPFHTARSQNLDPELLDGPGNFCLLIGFIPQILPLTTLFI